MQKNSFLAILLVVLFSVSPALAGSSVWVDTSNASFTSSITGLSFINADTGWVAESNGVVGTRNGWNTWFGSDDGTGIEDVIFLDENYGWHVGSNGVVRATKNGGMDWVTQSTNTNKRLRAIYFSDTLNGWASGDTIVLKTTDGGTTWQDISPPVDAIYHTVYFADALHGWVAKMNSIYIYKTIDGGSTWSQVMVPLSYYNVDDVHFSSKNFGVAVGGGRYQSGKVFVTRDGGDSWQSTSIGSGLRAVHFLDEYRGIVVGAYETIASTSDGGRSWQLDHTGDTDLNQIEIASKTRAYASGGAGYMLSGLISFGPVPLNAPSVIEVDEDFDSTVIADLDTVFQDDGPISYSINSSSSTISTMLSGSILSIKSLEPNFYGSAQVTIQAEDEDSNTSILELSINILSVNDPPVVSAIPDQVVNEDDSLRVWFYSLPTYISDVDNVAGDLTYSAYAIGDNMDDLEVSSGIDITMEFFQFKPAPDVNGEFTLVFAVTDSEGATGTDTVALVVNPVNDEPVLMVPDSISAYEHEYFVFHASAYDIDGDSLTWVWDFAGATGLEWIQMAGDSIFGIVGDTKSGDRMIEYFAGITVFDGVLADYASLKLQIHGENNPPSDFDLVAPLDSTVIPYWSTFSTNFSWETSTDNEDHPVYYQIEILDNSGWRFLGAEHHYDTNLDVQIDSFPRNKWLEWSVVARDDAKETKSSSTNLVMINDNFSLLSPSDSSLISYWGGRTLNFEWEHLAGNIRGVDYYLNVYGQGDWSFNTHVSQTGNVAIDIEDFPRSTWLKWEVVAKDWVSEVRSTEIFHLNIHEVVGSDDQIALPVEFCLNQNYPNPFNPTTSIRYGLPEQSQVKLIVLDITGRAVQELVQGEQAAGWYGLQWDGTDSHGEIVGSGTYLVLLEAGDYRKTIKMLYLK